MSGCVSVKSGVMRKKGCLKGATLAFCTWVCTFGGVWRTEVPSGVRRRGRALPGGGVGDLQAEKTWQIVHVQKVFRVSPVVLKRAFRLLLLYTNLYIKCRCTNILRVYQPGIMKAITCDIIQFEPHRFLAKKAMWPASLADTVSPDRFETGPACDRQADERADGQTSCHSIVMNSYLSHR